MTLIENKGAEGIEKDIVAMIKTCYDPEIPTNVYDLGLVYEIKINEENEVLVKMTLTSPGCPVADAIVQEVWDKVESAEGVSKGEVILTFEPPWDQHMMSEEAKLELGFL